MPDLRGYLQTKLPEYMVPQHFAKLEAIPLTPNGKVDRRALPAPDNLRQNLDSTYLAPRNELEQAIASIWQEVLKSEKVGVHDNFFEMGGHSLLTTQVASRLRRSVGVEVPLHRLFEATTVASLAELVQTIAWAAKAWNREVDEEDPGREVIGI